VQNRIILTDRAYEPSELTEAANFLNQNFAGLTFDEIKARIHDELRKLREDMTRLMTQALEASTEVMNQNSEDYVLSGSTTCCT